MKCYSSYQFWFVKTSILSFGSNLPNLSSKLLIIRSEIRNYLFSHSSHPISARIWLGMSSMQSTASWFCVRCHCLTIFFLVFSFIIWFVRIFSSTGRFGVSNLLCRVCLWLIRMEYGSMLRLSFLVCSLFTVFLNSIIVIFRPSLKIRGWGVRVFS